ncbi:MAG: pectate lyase family protein [Asticcacaulis sp.]
MSKIALAAAAAALIMIPVSSQAAQKPATAYHLDRATYDVKGWAGETRGGRGGRIIRVTNLNADGPGSLRAAIEADGPRIVVFEVGGVIDLNSQELRIRNPYITIAGQTAPSPGITLIRAETTINATHDVIIQHLMFRTGEAGHAKKSGWEEDALSTSASYNIIVDHCSMSWATDENLSASGPRFKGKDISEWRQNTSHNITFSHDLVYEGLRNSTHGKGEHSKGGLIHDNATGILLYGNLYASNEERNALFKGGVHAAEVNSMIYNPGLKAVHYNLIAHEWETHPYEDGIITLIGNVYRQGPDTRPGLPLFTLGGAGDVQLYMKDNIAVDMYGKPVAMTGTYTQGSAKIVEARTAYLPDDMRLIPAARLEDEIYESVGARPWDRDDVDFKILSDVAEGRGEIIDSEAQNYYGYPKYKPTAAPFVEAEWNLDDMSPKAGWASLFTKSYPKH